MAMSGSARRAYRKALKKKRKEKGGHWLFICKGDSAKEIASKLFTQLAVLVLIGCGVILVNEFRLSFSAKKLNESLKSIYQQYISHPSDGKILPGAEELLKLNSDTVGYICIDGTEVNFPVVQAKDNDTYLKTAFDGSSNKAGTVFLDYRNTLNANIRSDNLILYGHNQKDRTMFGSLKDYKKNVAHYKAHPTITFNSNYESDTYKIFAYFVTAVKPEQTDDGHIFDYQNYIDLSDKNEFNSFMSEIGKRTQIITSVDVKHGDEILTLSTCSNEFEPSRFVVFARKCRDNEDPTVDTSAAYLNPDAKEPDWDVIFG